MTGKELMKSFNRSSITHGLWAIRHSELDNPKSNPEQHALKKLCYQEAGLDDSRMSTHLYLWNLATKFQQMTFDLLIEVMDMYEKFDCKGQIKKPQVASKVVAKNVKKRRARFQLYLQDQKLTGSTRSDAPLVQDASFCSSWPSAASTPKALFFKFFPRYESTLN
jgi:hypothetical protein